ncbi:hypothetical protein AYO42_00455 [Rhizomicrobium sp. SCGC AG-212-E05]|nr:hypothetical protein AYO42_00455 [Rhizomicrobium sp. SCGC AG-212-E05]
MTLKRLFIRLLDRPVLRPLLSIIGSAKARQLLGPDVQIGFSDVWYHRVGGYAVPDGPAFGYYEPDILAWKTEVPTYFSNAEEFWLRSYRPKEGDIVVDIGAGRGEDALPFSEAVGPTGRVLAVEAHPATFERLKLFCALNKLANVEPVHTAIMDKPTVVHMDDADNWEDSSVLAPAGAIAVQAITFDQLCADHGIDRIDFLKMNIEGAEKFALLGMEKMLPKIREVCICAHDFRSDRGEGDFFRTRDFVIKFLSDAGFTVSRRENDPVDYVRDHILGVRSPLT